MLICSKRMFFPYGMDRLDGGESGARLEGEADGGGVSGVMTGNPVPHEAEYVMRVTIHKSQNFLITGNYIQFE